MKLTLAVSIFNQLPNTKGPLGLLRHMTSDAVEWLVVDNGSTDPVEDFVRKHLKPKRLNYIRNNHNLGLVDTYQQIFDHTESELLAIVHNDTYIYEPNWDKRIIKKFKDINKLGMIGFFGAAGVGQEAERIQETQFDGQMSGMSNMLEAQIHGMRLSEEFAPAAILDGFAMIFNMQFVKESGGIDRRYKYHHIYDRELPLLSLAYGYKNIVLNIPCHHESGVTANRSDYQQWISDKTGKPLGSADKWIHDKNTAVFRKKWRKYLPLYINSDFSFRTGRKGDRIYKGDAIKTFPKSSHQPGILTKSS